MRAQFIVAKFIYPPPKSYDAVAASSLLPPLLPSLLLAAPWHDSAATEASVTKAMIMILLRVMKVDKSLIMILLRVRKVS